MPTVGERKFGYNPEDISAAEQYATETGTDIEYEETGETAMYKKIQKTGGSPYKMKGNPMQRNFKDWWKQSKLKKDLKIAGDIIKKDVATIEGRLTKVGSKFKKDVEGLPSKLGIKKQKKK